MSRRVRIGLGAASALVLAGFAGLVFAQAETGDRAKGAALFDDRCSACHSMTDNLQGPHLAGVVGRKAGSVPGFDYSDAIKASGITWTPDKLDQFLAEPSKLAPGTAMPASVPDPAERRDLIAYLASVPSGGH